MGEGSYILYFSPRKSRDSRATIRSRGGEKGEGRKVRGKIGGQIRVEVCVECRGEKGDGEKESRSRVRTEGEICISRERNNRCHLTCLLPNVRSTDAV